jgi:hypothetical protein
MFFTKIIHESCALLVLLWQIKVDRSTMGKFTISILNSDDIIDIFWHSYKILLGKKIDIVLNDSVLLRYAEILYSDLEQYITCYKVKWNIGSNIRLLQKYPKKIWKQSDPWEALIIKKKHKRITDSVWLSLYFGDNEYMQYPSRPLAPAWAVVNSRHLIVLASMINNLPSHKFHTSYIM